MTRHLSLFLSFSHHNIFSVHETHTHTGNPPLANLGLSAMLGLVKEGREGKAKQGYP